MSLDSRGWPWRTAAALVLLGLLVPGPAGAAKPDKEKAAPEGTEATAGKEADDDTYVTFTKDHPEGTPKPDQALLYVVRPTSIGMAIKSFFFVDETIAGINRGSSYFFVDVAPGKRVFWSKSENTDAIEMTVEAGKTYYIQQQVQMGGFRARTKLKVLSEVEGRAALAKCSKHGVMGPAGKAKGDEYSATLKKNVQEDLDRRAREAEKEKSKGEQAPTSSGSR